MDYRRRASWPLISFAGDDVRNRSTGLVFHVRETCCLKYLPRSQEVSSIGTGVVAKCASDLLETASVAFVGFGKQTWTVYMRIDVRDHYSRVAMRPETGWIDKGSWCFGFWRGASRHGQLIYVLSRVTIWSLGYVRMSATACAMCECTLQHWRWGRGCGGRFRVNMSDHCSHVAGNTVAYGRRAEASAGSFVWEVFEGSAYQLMSARGIETLYAS